LIYESSGTNHVIVVQQGEELFLTLNKYCKQAGVKSGWLFALGGLESATIKVIYSSEPVKYDEEILDGPLELVSAIGNIAQKDQELVFHVHGTVSKEKSKIIRAGHLGECIANPFIECYIQAIDFPLTRAYDVKFETNTLIF